MEKSEYIKLQEDSSAWTIEDKIMNFATGKPESWGQKVEHYYLAFSQLLGEELYDDDVVLDIGCGDGSALYKFSRSNICTPMGMDLSEAKIKFCKDHFKNITALCALVENIPLGDKSVDHVFCSHTLEHSYDLDKALKEIKRITKRVVFFAVPLESEELMCMNPSHNYFSSDKKWWIERFKKAGFKEIGHHTPKSYVAVKTKKTKSGKNKHKVIRGKDLVFWGFAG